MAVEKFYVLAVDRFRAETQHPQRRKNRVRRSISEETTESCPREVQDADLIGYQPIGERRNSFGCKIIRKQRGAI